MLQADYGYMNCITLGNLCALFPKLYSSYNHSLLAVDVVVWMVMVGCVHVCVGSGAVCGW